MMVVVTAIAGSDDAPVDRNGLVVLVVVMLVVVKEMAAGSNSAPAAHKGLGRSWC
jgi:hypothetical protein